MERGASLGLVMRAVGRLWQTRILWMKLAVVCLPVLPVTAIIFSFLAGLPFRLEIALAFAFWSFGFKLGVFLAFSMLLV